MQANPRNSNDAPSTATATAVTDSPWFWVMLFAVFGLAALAAIGGKYGRRQAGIERKYQARERLGQTETAQQTAPDAQEYAREGATLIPLWPLAIVLAAVTIGSGWMLWRGRRRSQSPTIPQSHGSPP